MTTLWGIRGWRAVQSCRRLVLTAAAGSAGVLAGCSDMTPVAPPPSGRAVLAALPEAPRYLIELPAGQAPSSALAAQIRAEGGRIVFSHAPTGIVVVAGLTARSAGGLRMRNDVQAVVADVRRMRLTDPFFERMQVRSIRPPAVRARSFAPRGATDPRNAAFFGAQWNMSVIQADTAWQITSQGAGEKVFILDTGVDTTHIDLVGRVNTALSTSFADTGSSRVLLPFGHDVVGHGTFVSSLIATNSINIAAVAPQAQLVMVRVLGDDGSGSFIAGLEGIVYATENGADVINMSFGGYFNRTIADDMAFLDMYQRVVDYAFQRGILLVAAAGNERVDFNTATAPTGSYADSLNAPAGMHHVLSVGATGPVAEANFDDIAGYSNFGNDGVAVFAPGGNSVDTLPSDTADVQADLVIGACSSASALCTGVDTLYAVGAGTSFASPMVAGEAAVVKGQSKTIAGQALETCIATSSTEVTGIRPDPNYGFGRINVFSAVQSKSCK
jgi:lantibiotic leader peptide-processing serine protease